MKTILTLIIIILTLRSVGQQPYLDSMATYLAGYVKEHEVVPDSLKNGFHFYPVDPAYRVMATVTATRNSPWFSVETSGTQRKTFRVYAIARFTINGMPAELSLLQSQSLGTEYKDYLFLPFTDGTNGDESYTNGRYLDLQISDIKNGTIILDFNKAYNPYCAYVTGKYNCPIPPASNRLSVSIPAGEKKFGEHDMVQEKLE